MPARIDEIAPRIFRIASDVALPDGGGFSFNQYLIAADEPLLWHTGPRSLHAEVRAAIAKALDPATLRWIGFSHFEPDECGAMNQFLAEAPNATPVCSAVGAMIAGDAADRAPRGMKDGEALDIGGARLRWIDAPHVPHGWDCGLMFDETQKVFFCGDLFTQPGSNHAPLTEGDILGPSEDFRRAMDYYAHAPGTRARIEAMAALKPRKLACMHGSAWEGDGAGLLRELAASVSA